MLHLPNYIPRAGKGTETDEHLLYALRRPLAEAHRAVQGEEPQSQCTGEVREAQGGAASCPRLPVSSE